MVFYEIVRAHRGVKAAHMYGAFQQKMFERCDRFRVPYQGVSVQDIKKFATGKGNAPKEDVIAAVKVWGFNPKDDNEADAIALARLGWERYGS
jgi:Holliday junction resolvasome RuvABC endonuclease subunit